MCVFYRAPKLTIEMHYEGNHTAITIEKTDMIFWYCFYDHFQNVYRDEACIYHCKAMDYTKLFHVEHFSKFIMVLVISNTVWYPSSECVCDFFKCSWQ